MAVRIIRTLQTLFAAILLTAALPQVHAAKIDTELNHIILNTETSSAPSIVGDSVLFTYNAPAGTRSVAMALEHENYRRFYPYSVNRRGVFVLTMPKPGSTKEIRYRIIVDGLWTTDPNAAVIRDNRGITVSSVALPSSAAASRAGPVKLPDGRIRFVYKGTPGSRVALTGDFNRWDPYMTPMEESPVEPGTYSAVLSPPAGSRYYRFVVNGQDIQDPANLSYIRNGWGEPVSVLPR